MKAHPLITALLVASVWLLPCADASAQDEFDESAMVGFACFYEGRETELVRRFGKLLKRKRYASISPMLRSENNAERLMAVLCLERLASTGRVVLTEEDKALIHQIKTSDDPVDVCSGCIPTPGVPLKEAFNLVTLWRAPAWLDAKIGE